MDGIHEIDEKQYEKLSNYLHVIGYELLEKVEEDDYYETKYYSLVPSAIGAQRQKSSCFLFAFDVISASCGFTDSL